MGVVANKLWRAMVDGAIAVSDELAHASGVVVAAASIGDLPRVVADVAMMVVRGLPMARRGKDRRCGRRGVDEGGGGAVCGTSSADNEFEAERAADAARCS